MNIGIDARFYGKEHTGLGRYTMSVLHALADIDRKTKYTVFAKSTYKDKLDLPPNFSVVTCNIPHYSVSEQLLLPWVIKRNNIDLLYTFHLNVSIFTRTKTITTIHDLIKSHFTGKDTTTRNQLLYSLKRMGYDAVVKNTINKSSKIIVPSNFVKQDILTSYPDINKDKVIPIHEAPANIFTKANPKAKNPSPDLTKKSYLLFVGNAYPHKNLTTLLKSFTLALEDKPRLKLAIVSEKNRFLTKALSTLLKSQKKSITTISNIQDNELYWLYKNAICTITPSLMEGFGLVGLESMAVNTPVIASNIPVYKEIYKDNAIYFNPLDPEDLHLKIIDTINSPTKKRLSISPRTWNHVAKDIVKVIHEVSTSI